MHSLQELICRIVGCDYDKLFIQCKRCGKESPLSKIANAMAAPLKRTLDYKSISQRLKDGK